MKLTKRFWERAFILTVILTILFSGIALGTFSVYEGNSPKLKYIVQVIPEEERINGRIEKNNYTIVEIINMTKSKEVVNGTIFIGNYIITISLYSEANLNIYLINYENYLKLNLTKDINKVENIYKIQNKSYLSKLEIELKNSKEDAFYLIFENKNNISANFTGNINTPKISIEDNKEEINKYENENQYLKTISNISIILLIILFFATVFSAYRWLKSI